VQVLIYQILICVRPTLLLYVVILKDGDILKLPNLLPGWEVTIPEIWSPVFK
jgi:Uma2 family endonuclease